MDRQDIHFPPSQAALRDDVHAVGGLVGEVLRDQGGDELFSLVEGDRVAAIRRRAGDESGAAELAMRTAARSPAVAQDLVRAFSTWFQVVNLAEKVHRVRRRRNYLNDSDRPQPGGIGDAIMRLKVDGHSAEQALALLRDLTLRPTFTTHPTEVTRRTMLRKQQQIASLMIERLDPSQTPDERRLVWERVRMELTSGWQTENHPRERLTVADEREHVLFYLTEVIYRIIPAFYEEIEFAFEHAYGIDRAAMPLPIMLHFGTWVGGDMDGNPEIHAKAIRETLHRQQKVIISTYYDECLALADRLSQSASRVGVSRQLEGRIEEYLRLLPGTQSIAPARHDRMPYRLFLSQIAERLKTTYDGNPNQYEHVGQFEADVLLVADSLRNNKGTHAGLFPVERLLRRIRTFGFHLATLDIRQHADVHRQVIGEGFGDAGWEQRPVQERTDALGRALERDQGPVSPLGATGRRTLAVFEAMVQCRHRYGRRAVGDYIVCGTRDLDDLLSVLLLARWADVTDKKTGQAPIDVVPLFDTVPTLQRSAEVMQSLFDDPRYRRHLESRGRRQTVLVGYSDSNKGSGIATARFGLYQAQRALVVSFGWNYRPMVQRAKAMLDEVGIGELEQLSVFMASATRDLLSNRGAYPDAAPESVPEQATWTDRRLSGGGYGQAQLSHALGLALWLTGARAESGFALASAPLDAPVELHNAIAYTYDGGAIGVVSGGSAHTGAWNNKHSLEVRGIGSRGQFLIDVEREAFWLHADGSDRELDVVPGEGLYDCVGPIDAVLAAARGEEFVNQSPAELGARTVEALDIAYRSADAGTLARRA